MLRGVPSLIVVGLALVSNVFAGDCGYGLTPGDVGRYYPTDLKTCVCNYDDYCCSDYWDSGCVHLLKDSYHCNYDCKDDDVVFYPAEVTWQQAKDYCHAYGMELLSIHSEAELAAALEVLYAYTEYSYAYVKGAWIGLNDKDYEGTFEWSDGTDVDYTPWGPYEPNGGYYHDCVELSRPMAKCPDERYFNDRKCDEYKPYFCKKKRTPTPTDAPTAYPTAAPTPYPTNEPTAYPTKYPTKAPTAYPTAYPTKEPTAYPTKYPTKAPTAYPTKYPTKAPTAYPTKEPTAYPTKYPTKAPTAYPTKAPTKAPTAYPTEYPTPIPDYCELRWEHGKHNWYYAEQNCVNQGGHLVSIHTQAEEDAVRQLASVYTGDGYWIGAYTDNYGTSTWTDGTSFDYHSWGSYHPEHGECGGFNQFDTYWWDNPCSQYHYSICKVCNY